MSILIKGMEMPTDCPMCPLSHWDFTGKFRGCKEVKGKRYAMETEPEYFDSNYRPPWCPLVPIPPHGRLIDADAFIKSECNSCDGACESMTCECLNCEADCRCDFMKDIAGAPTIIEAEDNNGADGE